MISKKRLLKNWKIYAIFDDSLFPDRRELLKKFNELLKSPIDAAQLRFVDFSDPFIYRTAREMVKRAKEKNIPLIINDKPEIALALGAAGVHLGKSDIPAPIARQMLGPDAIIGRTIRGVGDLTSINKRDVDYVSIGPVFRTPIKPGLKAVSSARLREVCKNPGMPLVAIGGINEDNVLKITALGIRTVAFVRYGITEKDTRKKITELKNIITMETG
jgi:thiamine-phosphate diphosphorylase